MKKIIIVIVVIGALIIGWYLISPIVRVVEVDEASPLGQNDIRNNFEEMSQDVKAKFMEEVETMKNQVIPMSDPMTVSKIIAQADFVPSAHDVQGRGLLIDSEDGKILRFENFETINGPNLHIYLATDFTGKDYVDLGKIKATKGNVNYEIDSSVNTEKYNKVLVWCVPFRVLFSYADLKPL